MVVISGDGDDVDVDEEQADEEKSIDNVVVSSADLEDRQILETSAVEEQDKHGGSIEETEGVVRVSSLRIYVHRIENVFSTTFLATSRQYSKEILKSIRLNKIFHNFQAVLQDLLTLRDAEIGELENEVMVSYSFLISHCKY